MNKNFKHIEKFQKKLSDYSLLPFNFDQFEDEYILTNIVGDNLFLDFDNLQKLINHKLSSDSSIYDELKSNFFLYDDSNRIAALNLLALRYRTKKYDRSYFTGLHIFVVSLRCDHSCPYCQVSRQNTTTTKFDMTQEIADKGIEFAFKSPNNSIKIEFQGGESMLNFELIKYITNQVNKTNINYGKNIQFVIATNLSFLSNEILNFCKLNDIHISTSLDGPEELHNKNRPKINNDSYKNTKSAIDRAQKALGFEKVSALMTTTEDSLKIPEKIIDEYINSGFQSIFLRPLSPYGFAIKTKTYEKYKTKEWLNFYKKGLNYIMELNLNGIRFVEYYASVLLTKILTPYDTGYVDLQSPAGTGLSAIVFNYDGAVYSSDEARMLAEMGDETFNLGNLLVDSYEKIMTNPILLSSLEDSMTISSPMCCDCAFIEYCGSDPTYHYATQKDFTGFKPLSGFCEKNMEISKYLLSLMKEEKNKRIFYSWLRI